MLPDAIERGRPHTVEARIMLEQSGYIVMKRATPSSLFDFAAIRSPNQILFIAVRISHSRSLAEYQDLLQRLTAAVRHGVPGPVQLWLKIGRGVWSRYQVLDGGAIPIRSDTHA